MPSGATLAAFAGASLLLIVLPGPAMLFLLARGASGGPRVGALSALGVESASAVYVLATTAGLTALLATSAAALTAIRYAGAGYLAYLGIRTILHRAEPVVPHEPGRAAPSAWRSWSEGFVVGITNPKVALFFLAFFPQFIHAGAGPVATQVLLLGTVFVVIGGVLDVAYGVAGGALTGLVRGRSRGVRRSRVAAGCTYLALAGWTAAGQGRSSA